MSEIPTLWVLRGRHFAMTNKLKPLNVKTDYITYREEELGGDSNVLSH